MAAPQVLFFDSFFLSLLAHTNFTTRKTLPQAANQTVTPLKFRRLILKFFFFECVRLADRQKIAADCRFKRDTQSYEFDFID